MLKLCCKLMILQDGQVSGRLQLLVIHCKQVSLCLLDVEEHLLAKLFSLFDPIELLLIDLLQSESFLILDSLLQVGKVFIEFCLD